MSLQKWVEYGWLRSHKTGKKKSPIFSGSSTVIYRTPHEIFQPTGALG